MSDNKNNYQLEYSRVQSTIDVIKKILSGQDSEFCFDQEPSRKYSIGIISPLTEDEEKLEEQKKQWIRKRRPDSLGFEARLKTNTDKIQLNISINFNLYYRCIPSYQEQLKFSNYDTVNKPKTRDKLRFQLKYKRVLVHLSNIPVSLSIPSVDKIQEINCEEVTNALNHALETKASEIIHDPNCWFVEEPDLLLSVLESEETYNQAVYTLEKDKPSWKAKLSGKVWPTKEGHWRINLLLTNITETEKVKHQVSFFNCKITCVPSNAEFISVPFKAALRDYRYPTETWGRGINCVLNAKPNIAETETIPIFEQLRTITRDNMKESCSFSRLSSDKYLDELENISKWLHEYSQGWKKDNEEYKNSESYELRKKSVADFDKEIERYLFGVEALKADARLSRAFRLMNKAFSRGKHAGWRLFQLVFVVTQMSSLLAREIDDPKYKGELEKVDVLWFPTGGGKTEAYFGVIVTAMFFDRLRGKSRGVTAWLRYPLRMLSIQQLQRLVDIVAIADEIRKEEKDSLFDSGDPFRVGYYVGSGNTPNDLTQPNNPKFPGGPLKPIMDIKTELDNLEDKGDHRYRVLQRCSFCESTEMYLDANTEEVRIRHICKKCKREAPIYITDAEIYRFAPSVIVGTVDRLARAGQTNSFSHIFGQYTHKCPRHGYVSFNKCIESSVCDVKPKQYEELESNYDPCPSLLLQDELHLLKESLGTYDSHYETFIDLLAENIGKKLPPKRIAATATIEGYERHVWELYGREAIRFPVKGKGLNDSAYSQNAPNNEVARIYVGVMPTGASTEETASKISNNLKVIAYNELDSKSWTQAIVDNYDLSLIYVNQKNTAGNIRSMWDEGDDIQVLTGDKGLNEVREVIGRIEEKDPRSDFKDRLRSVVATSLISHGVDLERLNYMAFCGMPNHASDYIQASSRVGRNHIGVVFTVFRPDNNRERNIYHRFYEYHDRLYQLVLPVPIIRFSESSIRRTITGILSSCILNILSHQKYEKTHTPLEFKKDFISAYAKGFFNDNELITLVKQSYKIDDLHLTGSAVNFFNYLIEKLVKEQRNIIVNNIEDFMTYKCMVPRPVSSLREVSEQIGFSIGRKSNELWSKILEGRRYTDGGNN